MRSLTSWALVLGSLVGGLGATVTPIRPGAAPVEGVLDALDLEVIPEGTTRSGPEYWREIFEFRGNAGQMAQVNLTANFDCYLVLLGPGGTELASNDDYQDVNTSRVVATLAEGGTHQAVVTSFSEQTGGNFTISVNALVDPPPPSPDRRISLGQTVEGTLAPSDNAVLVGDRGEQGFFRDGYAFRGRAGDAIIIEATFDFDGYLYLVGPGGEVVASNDDWGTVRRSRISTTLSESGSHRIVVTSYSQGVTGSYTLTLREATEEDASVTDPSQTEFTDGALGQQGLTQDPSFHESMLQAPPPPDGEEPTPRGNVQIVSEPVNVRCEVGDRFLTSVMYRSLGGAPFDEVRLCLTYDPARLRPLRVSDHKMRSHLANPATLDGDLRAGLIEYEASLAEPHKGLRMEMITVEWVALMPADHTRITLSTDGEAACALRLSGRDLLTVSTEDGRGGTIATDVQIRPHGEEEFIGARLLDGTDAADMAHLQGLALGAGARLRVVADREAVRLGEFVEVDVVFDNPTASALDELSFTLAFDPRVFEALDAARGGRPPGDDNWIVRGVNLLDAPFHEAFPFDLHQRNEIDNRTGLAIYHMGLSRAQVLEDGTLARLRLRARAPAARTRIRFVGDEDPRGVPTVVRFQGADLLGDLSAGDPGTHGLVLSVRR